MDRKSMMALTVAAAAVLGTLAAPADAQSMYDGIGTGSSSPVMGPTYQYLAPEGAPVTGPLPNEVIVAPQSGVNTDEAEGSVGLSSPEVVYGYEAAPSTTYTYDAEGNPIPNTYLAPEEPDSTEDSSGG
jgi:hypothetical protein